MWSKNVLLTLLQFSTPIAKQFVRYRYLINKSTDFRLKIKDCFINICSLDSVCLLLVETWDWEYLPWVKVCIQYLLHINFALFGLQNFCFWIKKMDSVENILLLLLADQILFIHYHDVRKLNLFCHEFSNGSLNLSFLIQLKLRWHLFSGRNHAVFYLNEKDGFWRTQLKYSNKDI